MGRGNFLNKKRIVKLRNGGFNDDEVLKVMDTLFAIPEKRIKNMLKKMPR